MTRTSKPVPSAQSQLVFRLPFSAVQRSSIKNVEIGFGGDATTKSNDALVIKGTWLADQSLQVRPIFSGTLSFIPNSPLGLPQPNAFDCDTQGRITDESLDTVLKNTDVDGYLCIQILEKASLKSMQKLGVISEIAESPTTAIMGPVRITKTFLRNILGEKPHGLPTAKIPGKVLLSYIGPGDLDWESRAVVDFLKGDYSTKLRGEIDFANIDADIKDGLLPMPEVIVDTKKGDFNFSLTIWVGWLKDPEKWKPKSDVANDQNFETIPTVVFLNQVADEFGESLDKDDLSKKMFAEVHRPVAWGRSLTNALKELGFGSLNEETHRETILREFQISATSQHVARPIQAALDGGVALPERDFRTLERVGNDDQYFGHISGRANQRTRSLVEIWRNKRLRCPVVMPAFSDMNVAANGIPSGDPLDKYADLWGRLELKDAHARVFAADFTRTDRVSARISHSDLETIGFSVIRPKADGELQVRGPNTITLANLFTKKLAGTWAEATPKRLLDEEESGLIDALENPGGTNAKLLSTALTYRVVRAMSECECAGMLDQVTAWDDAGISIGVCHWSMAGTTRWLKDSNPAKKTAAPQNSSCELGAVAAYFEWLRVSGTMPALDVFRTVGLAPAAAYTRTALAQLANKSSNTGTFLAVLRFIDDRGLSRPMAVERGNGSEKNPADLFGPRDDLPSWRSFYRWIRVGRTSPDFARAVWNMTLRRLKVLLNKEFDRNVVPEDLRQKPGAPIRIRDVFTSELLVAQLLRWHVKHPDRVVEAKTGRASPELVKIYKAASKDPAVKANPRSEYEWANALEHLLANVSDDLLQDMQTIKDPTWVKQPTTSSERPIHLSYDFGYQLDACLRLLSWPDVAVPFRKFQLKEPIDPTPS